MIDSICQSSTIFRPMVLLFVRIMMVVLFVRSSSGVFIPTPFRMNEDSPLHQERMQRLKQIISLWGMPRFPSLEEYRAMMDNTREYYTENVSLTVTLSPFQYVGRDKVIAYFSTYHPDINHGNAFADNTFMESHQYTAPDELMFQRRVTKSFLSFTNELPVIVSFEGNRIREMRTVFPQTPNRAQTIFAFVPKRFCAMIGTHCDDGFGEQRGLASYPYANDADCHEEMVHLPYKCWKSNVFWGNSRLCRVYHYSLAATIPEDHCAHIGLVSDGKCRDVHCEDSIYCRDRSCLHRQKCYEDPLTFRMTCVPWKPKIGRG